MKLGLLGKARVGKDKFAGYLIGCLEKRHQRNFIHIAFATELKNMCKFHFGLSDDQLWESGKDIREVPDKRFVKERLVPKFRDEDSATFKCGTIREPLYEYWTPREIMQEFGSFYRRIQGDYWVRALERHIEFEGLGDVIITDVRHINECEYIKNNKGVLIQISRPTVEKIHGMEHESETALDDMPDGYFDIEINNHGTLNDLYKAAEDTSDAIIMLERMIQKGEVYNGE